MGIPVAVAIFVGLACSFIQSLGLTIQRKSHVQDEALPQSERRRAVTRPLWIMGFAIYITSNIFGSVFQIGALPIVVLAPLGGVSLLWNSLLAHLLLGEGFTSPMMLGTAFVATGAVLIAVFGVVPEGNHSLDDLLTLWARPPFVVFFSIICLAVVAVLVAAHVSVWRAQGGIKLPDDDGSPSNYASPRPEPAIPFRTTALGMSPRSSISTVELPAPDGKFVRFNVPDESPTDRRLAMCGLAFAAASGTLSGLCLVLAKAAVELVIATIDHWRTGRGTNEFTRVQTWFLVAGLGLAAVLQLVYLNYSLAFASPALICPLAFCFYNLASIFDGLVFYDQLGRLRVHQVVLVSIGVAVLLVGVWTVSAIQPTGDGGVEVGTWVEEGETWEHAVSDEAHDELEPAQSATLLGGEISEEPEHHPEASHPTDARPPPIDTSSESSSHVPPSPHSPVSPKRRRLRYGTLLPDLALPSAPTGFAFGIGAASPGFALRSNSISYPVPRPPRRSLSGDGGTARRRRGQSVAVLPGPLGLPQPVQAPQEVEETLASWDEAPQRRWFWQKKPKPVRL